eukprot:5191735-Prymnesium_polylepis.1
MLPAGNFTQTELASEHFAALRRAADVALRADPDAAAVFESLLDLVPDPVADAVPVAVAVPDPVAVA